MIIKAQMQTVATGEQEVSAGTRMTGTGYQLRSEVSVVTSVKPAQVQYDRKV